MPTLQELASRLGVSVATVSRALNDQPGVSDEKRQKVLDLAKELNYHPNLAARSLATSRTQNVLFITHRRQFSTTEDPFYPYIMHGLEDALSDGGYGVMLVTLNDSQLDSGLSSVRAFNEQQPGGIVLAGPDISSSFILAASASGIPMILVDNALRRTSLPAVLPDNEEGSEAATSHLLEVHNHTSVVLLRGPEGWVSSDERTSGYLAAMEAAGRQPMIVKTDDTTIETGQRAAEKALLAHPEATAIVAVNDAMAIGAIRAARKDGRDVPQDLAIVGFDNISWAKYADPPLTTVSIPTVEMGRLAGRLLVERMAGSLTEISHTRVATHLVVRESCGCTGGGRNT